MRKATEIEIARIMDSHDDGDEQQATPDHSALQSVCDRLKEARLTASDVEIIFGINRTAISEAVDSRKLPQYGHVDYGYYFEPSDVFAWLTQNDIRYEVSPAAETRCNMRPAEVIDPAEVHDAGQWATFLGIDESAILAAYQSGALRANTHCIAGSALVAWLESSGVKPNWGISQVLKVERERKRAQSAAAEAEYKAAQPKRFDIAEAAFAQLESENQTADNESHRQYVAILRRRSQPQHGDIEALAKVVRELGYDRDRVNFDIGTLDKMAQAEAGSVGQFEAESAVKAAVDERDAMRKRHEREVQSAENKLNAARYNLNQIARFKREVIELREKRPDLFGTSV